MPNNSKQNGQKNIDEVQLIKEELPGFDETKVGLSRLLFLDMSSSCTGYAIAEVDFAHKSAKFLNAGAIWFDKDWDNQEKYHYIFNAVTNYFNIISKIDYCIAEAYMINHKRMSGCLVGPELHGVLQVALAEIGIKYRNIPVQTWRKHLGIKKDPEGDFKLPVKRKLEEYVKLPATVPSNITKMHRAFPDDISDAMGIGLGFLMKLGIKNFNLKDIKFQEEIGLL